MNSMTRVFWTETAKRDLEEIVEYIATATSAEIALKQYSKIKDNVLKLDKFPEQGRVIPELQIENIIKFREIIVKPWRIMYKVEEGKVYILSVIDGRRNIEDVLLKRQLR